MDEIFTDWKITGEQFKFMDWFFSVDAAKMVLKDSPRPTVFIPPKALADAAGIFTINAIKTPESADLDTPIILAQVIVNNIKCVFTIDGWHRLKFAYVNNIPTIKAVYLTPQETLFAGLEGSLDHMR